MIPHSPPLPFLLLIVYLHDHRATTKFHIQIRFWSCLRIVFCHQMSLSFHKYPNSFNFYDYWAYSNCGNPVSLSWNIFQSYTYKNYTPANQYFPCHGDVTRPAPGDIVISNFAVLFDPLLITCCIPWKMQISHTLLFWHCGSTMHEGCCRLASRQSSPGLASGPYKRQWSLELWISWCWSLRWAVAS